MERDPKTGKFLSGNKVAAGNKGNHKPKWGNKNALKHGFFQTFIFPELKDDGNLYLHKKGLDTVVIKPAGFFKDEEGKIRIRNDVAEYLEEIGFVL